MAVTRFLEEKMVKKGITGSDGVIRGAIGGHCDTAMGAIGGHCDTAMGAIGGHCDTAMGASVSIIVCPLCRGRIPTKTPALFDDNEYIFVPNVRQCVQNGGL